MTPGQGSQTQTLSALEQLAILVKIRRIISGPQELPIEQINSQLDLVSFVKYMCHTALSHITSTNEKTELDQQVTRFLTLEILWIMANVAHGPKTLVEDMLFEASAEYYNAQVLPSYALALAIHVLTGTTDQMM